MKGELYRTYSRILSACYALAAGMRLLDLCDRRLHFSTMGLLGQAWTVYLLASDLLCAASLARPSPLGNLVFVAVMLTQLAVFVGWSPYLQDAAFTVTFHLVTLSVFLVLVTYGPGEVRPEG